MTGLKVRQLPEYGAALQAAGFALARRKIWLGGLLVSELWVAQRASDGEELALSTRPLNVQEARVTAWSAIEKNTSIN